MAEAGGLRVELGHDGPAVEWDLDAIGGGEGGLPFSISPPLERSRWELARVLSAAFDDGVLLALAALRPAGARGHGEEAVAGVVVRDGAPVVVDEALLSVEYDPDGTPRRVGVEIYERPDSLPLRMAGDREAAEPASDETTFSMRSGEASGTGRLVIVRPG
jgi:hypothetical protein